MKFKLHVEHHFFKNFLDIHLKTQLKIILIGAIFFFNLSSPLAQTDRVLNIGVVVDNSTWNQYNDIWDVERFKSAVNEHIGALRVGLTDHMHDTYGFDFYEQSPDDFISIMMSPVNLNFNSADAMAIGVKDFFNENVMQEGCVDLILFLRFSPNTFGGMTSSPKLGQANGIPVCAVFWDPGQNYDRVQKVRNVIAHEIGHAFDLIHSPNWADTNNNGVSDFDEYCKKLQPLKMHTFLINVEKLQLKLGMRNGLHLLCVLEVQELMNLFQLVISMN